MPIETINFNGHIYPKFQSEGFASEIAFGIANKILFGKGVDVGCNRVEWMLPSTELRTVFPIDPVINGFDGLSFPKNYNNLDFIFSSHCLEHLPNWVDALNHWHNRLKVGGVVFLYLPDFSQEYWRNWNNRKHVHCFTPEIIGAYFKTQPNMWKNTFVSGVDLNNSFMLISEKI